MGPGGAPVAASSARTPPPKPWERAAGPSSAINSPTRAPFSSRAAAGSRQGPGVAAPASTSTAPSTLSSGARTSSLAAGRSAVNPLGSLSGTPGSYRSAYSPYGRSYGGYGGFGSSMGGYGGYGGYGSSMGGYGGYGGYGSSMGGYGGGLLGVPALDGPLGDAALSDVFENGEMGAGSLQRAMWMFASVMRMMHMAVDSLGRLSWLFESNYNAIRGMCAALADVVRRLWGMFCDVLRFLVSIGPRSQAAAKELFRRIYSFLERAGLLKITLRLLGIGVKRPARTRSKQALRPRQ